MKLSQLFTSRNIEIFKEIDAGEGSVREIAGRANSSPAKVHNAAQLFLDAGIITTRKRKNMLILALNRAHPVTQKMKALINVHRILSGKSFEELKKADALLLYGSYATGTDDESSDIDLLVITEKRELALRPTIRRLGSELSRKVNPLVLRPEEYEQLEEKDPEFALRLKYTSIVLHGDTVERY